MVVVPLGQPSSRLQHTPQMGAILNLRESQLYIYYGFKLTLSWAQNSLALFVIHNT